MASIELIGKDLAEDLINLQGNPTTANTIVRKINSYKDPNGEFINDRVKNRIIEEIGKNLPLYECESSDELRKLLQTIKDKVNGK